MLANPGHPPGYPGASPDTTQAAFESRLKSQRSELLLPPPPHTYHPPHPPYPESCWRGQGYHRVPPGMLRCPSQMKAPLRSPGSGGIAVESAVWDPRVCNHRLWVWLRPRPSVCLSLVCWLASIQHGGLWPDSPCSGVKKTQAPIGRRKFCGVRPSYIRHQ